MKNESRNLVRRVIYGTGAFLVGALVLSVFATLQKIAIGAPLVLKGYFIPFLFGGSCGFVIGTWYFRLNLFAAELRESEAMLRTIFNGISDPIHMIDSDYRVVATNERLLELRGLVQEEIVGKHCYEVYQNRDTHCVECAARESFATGRVAQVDKMLLLLKDGSCRWFEVYAFPILADDGSVGRMIELTRDVTEREQAETEIARLATVVEQAAVTVVITDLEGGIVYANPDFETSSGYSVAEALAQNPRILKSDRQDASFYQELWDTITAGRTWNGVFVNKRKDGELYHEQATIFPIKNATGEIINYAAVKRDVSERVRAEQALKESEKRYRSIFENMTDVYYKLDTEGNILAASPSAVKLYQCASLDEIIGKRALDFVYNAKDVDALFVKAFERAKTGQVAEYDYRLDMGAGDEWFSAKLSPMFVEDKFAGVVAVARNITVRKRAEEERELLLAQINEQAKRIQQTIDAVPEGVLLLDDHGQVVLANPVAEKDLRVLIGRDDIPTHEPITHLGDRPLAELLTSPPTKGLWHEVKVGARTFEIIARPIENGPEPENACPEPAEGWVLVINDVTQERAAREQLQRQERLAAVGQLAAGIAHDFNNIMAVIVLYAQMTARDKTLPARVQERMATIHQQAQHATRLIQQILDFSRRAVLERQPFDLLPLLKEQVGLLKRTLPESIEVKLDYGPGEHIVNADPTRMQQTIMNLAVNARDAMSEGGNLRIGLERVEIASGKSPILPEMAPGEWVRLTVSDTGAGIPSDALPHIFDPFFSTKEPGAGTGLGLAQVHGIVGAHEGRVGVETQVGEGTTFTIYLPALPSHPVEPSEPELFDLPKGRGETLLVVEDKVNVREVLAESLKSLNYRVLQAANGQEALEVLEQSPPSSLPMGGKEGGRKGGVALVLSDVVMPNMGGISLFHALKQQFPALPVIFLTGHPMEEELKGLHAQGLGGWMLKPPNIERLAQMVNRVLNEESE